MTRRRLKLILALYLIATAASAPLAYFVGASQNASAANFVPVSYNSAPGAFVDTTEHIWWCIQFGDYPGLRNNLRERVCGRGRGGKPSRTPRLRRTGPLQDALALAIVGDGVGYTPKLYEVPEPTSALAAAPAPAAQFGPIGTPGGGGGSAIGSPPGTGPFFGQPATLLTGLGASSPPPPPLVTPLPAGIPLMVTGIWALLGVSRQRPAIRR